MLQAGEPPRETCERLERAYYGLTAWTSRHFREEGRGWFVTGVAGLDAPTMNRAVVDSADVSESRAFLGAAERFFGERELSWNVVLSSFRPASSWHSELLARGLHPSSSLDVLTRDPDLPVPEAPRGVEVRLARADEVGAFTEVVMEVFRMPRRFFPALLDMTEAWRARGAKLYVVESEERLVATALLANVDGVAGIYNVGTVRHARGQGLAHALMARALGDARGADLVTLQVAPEGFVEGYYLRLGFSPTYRWRFYSPRGRIRA